MPSLLGDHFSPALALLAPVRWLGLEAVLAAQALLVVAAALPIFWFALSRHHLALPQPGVRPLAEMQPPGGVSLQLWPARAVAVSYLLFGGVVEALWFDFHEVAFAPLLIAFGVLLRGWKAVACVLALLLVKEDLAFLVSAFGVLFWLRGERRAGVALAVGGVVAYAVITGPLMPGDYTYGEQYPGPVLEAAGQKLRTLAYLLGAFAGLSLLSPVFVLALPLLAARFLSDNEKHWTLEDHYSLTVAPVLALAAADGLRRFPRAWVALPVIAVACLPFFLQIPTTTPHAYRAAEDALALVPPGAPVTASNRLVPHLSARDDVRLPDRPPARFVIIALEDGTPEGLFPFETVAERDEWIAKLGADPIFRAEGMLVARLPGLNGNSRTTAPADGPAIRAVERAQAGIAPGKPGGEEIRLRSGSWLAVAYEGEQGACLTAALDDQEAELPIGGTYCGTPGQLGRHANQLWEVAWGRPDEAAFRRGAYVVYGLVGADVTGVSVRNDGETAAARLSEDVLSVEISGEERDAVESDGDVRLQDGPAEFRLFVAALPGPERSRPGRRYSPVARLTLPDRTAVERRFPPAPEY